MDEGVLAALSAFPLDVRASLGRIVHLIEAHGLERMREPCVKHLEGPVWEMRRAGATRATASSCLEERSPTSTKSGAMAASTSGSG